MGNQHAIHVPKETSGPLTSAEIELLRDMQGFLDFAVRNGLSFLSVMSALSHDVNGLWRYGCDLEAAERDGFSPHTAGYSHVDDQAIGEPEEALDSVD